MSQHITPMPTILQWCWTSLTWTSTWPLLRLIVCFDRWAPVHLATSRIRTMCYVASCPSHSPSKTSNMRSSSPWHTQTHQRHLTKKPCITAPSWSSAMRRCYWGSACMTTTSRMTPSSSTALATRVCPTLQWGLVTCNASWNQFLKRQMEGVPSWLKNKRHKQVH